MEVLSRQKTFIMTFNFPKSQQILSCISLLYMQLTVKENFFTVWKGGMPFFERSAGKNKKK